VTNIVVSCLFDYCVEGYIKTYVYRYDKFPKIITARHANIMKKHKNTKIKILNYNTNICFNNVWLEQNFSNEVCTDKGETIGLR
jgi:hypothetical protein